MSAHVLPDALRDQITRSRIALSLASVDTDMPLRMVNTAFTRLTGYGPEQVEGRNCRFLQRKDTPPGQIRDMGDFLRDGDREDGRFPVVNQTREGRRFTNLVFMAKLRGGDGVLRFVIASQFDASASEAAGMRAEHDRGLSRNMADLRVAAGQFGLIMADSSELIARSITTLARITVRDE